MTAPRRVLMVSPHFPPDSSAASHRLRLLAPHMADAGWVPTVVAVEPSAYEGRLDPELALMVPPTLNVVRAPAWSAQWTRKIGIGDLGIRAFHGISRLCRTLLARERFDALFITVYPVYPALLGGPLKRKFNLPFVLDFQDPWIGAWGANNARPWKRRLPTAAPNADSPRFVSVAMKFGATTKRCGNRHRHAGAPSSTSPDLRPSGFRAPSGVRQREPGRPRHSDSA